MFSYLSLFTGGGGGVHQEGSQSLPETLCPKFFLGEYLSLWSHVPCMGYPSPVTGSAAVYPFIGVAPFFKDWVTTPPRTGARTGVHPPPPKTGVALSQDWCTPHPLNRLRCGSVPRAVSNRRTFLLILIFNSSAIIKHLIFIGLFSQYHKKVLLRERKRHTARRVVSTPSVVLTGYRPGRVLPPRRVPPPNRVAPLWTDRLMDGWKDRRVSKHYLPVVLPTRAVIISHNSVIKHFVSTAPRSVYHQRALPLRFTLSASVVMVTKIQMKI